MVGSRPGTADPTSFSYAAERDRDPLSQTQPGGITSQRRTVSLIQHHNGTSSVGHSYASGSEYNPVHSYYHGLAHPGSSASAAGSLYHNRGSLTDSTTQMSAAAIRDGRRSTDPTTMAAAHARLRDAEREREYLNSRTGISTFSSDINENAAGHLEHLQRMGAHSSHGHPNHAAGGEKGRIEYELAHLRVEGTRSANSTLVTVPDEHAIHDVHGGTYSLLDYGAETHSHGIYFPLASLNTLFLI